MKEGFLKLCRNVITGIFTVLVLYFFLSSIFSSCVMIYTNFMTYYVDDCMPLLVVCIVLFIWALVKLQKHVTEKAFIKGCKIFTIIWFILFIVFLWASQLPPVADQEAVYELAKDLLRGDLSLWRQKGGYLYMYPFQNSLVLLFVPFVAVFGEGAYIAVSYFNMLCWYGTALLMSKLAGEYFDKRTAAGTYLAMLCFVPMWGLSTMVYGTVPGLFFAALAIREEKKFEKTGKWKNILLCGICMFIALMWKANFVIFLAALCIMLFLAVIKKSGKKEKESDASAGFQRYQGIIGIVLLIIVGVGEINGVPYFMQEVSGGTMSQGLPTISWIDLGIHESGYTPGWDNARVRTMYKKCDYDAEKTYEAVSADIQDALQTFRDDKAYALQFFGYKTASIWNDPAFEGFMIVSGRNYSGTLSYPVKDILYDGGMMNLLLLFLLNIMQTLVWFGILLYLVLERKNLRLEHLVLAITFIGGFLFYLAWEAKCQYTVPFYIILFPYAARGWVAVTDFIKERSAESETGKGKELLKGIRKTTEGKLGIALAVVLLILQFSSFYALSCTIKAGGQQRDYLWFCMNRTEWKSPDYVMQRGVDE